MNLTKKAYLFFAVLGIFLFQTQSQAETGLSIEEFQNLRAELVQEIQNNKSFRMTLRKAIFHKKNRADAEERLNSFFAKRDRYMTISLRPVQNYGILFQAGSASFGKWQSHHAMMGFGLNLGYSIGLHAQMCAVTDLSGEPRNRLADRLSVKNDTGLMVYAVPGFGIWSGIFKGDANEFHYPQVCIHLGVGLGLQAGVSLMNDLYI